MAKKRKPTFTDAVVDEMKRLDALKYDPEADFDAVERSIKELATAAHLRKPVKRKKSLEQQIEEAEKRAAAKAAAEKTKAEQAEKRRKARAKAKKEKKKDG